MTESLDFSGRAVVVTGGARGLGRAITEAFLGAGAEVAICGRNQPATDELPREGAVQEDHLSVGVASDEASPGVIAGRHQRRGAAQIARPRHQMRDARR